MGTSVEVFGETAIEEDEILSLAANAALTIRLGKYPGAGNVNAGRSRYVVVSTATVMSDNIDWVATLRDALFGTWLKFPRSACGE